MELEQGANNSIIRWRNNRRKSSSSSSSSVKPSGKIRRGSNEASMSKRELTADDNRTAHTRHTHLLLLGEPTSFAPCRLFVLSHHKRCRQPSSFRCSMQLSCLCSGQSIRAETKLNIITTVHQQRRVASVAPHHLYTGGEVGWLKSKKYGGFSIRNGKLRSRTTTRRDEQIPFRVKHA